MRRVLGIATLVVGLLLAALLIGCGGGDESSGTGSSETTASEAAGASPRELTKAYGELVGMCLASEFTESLEFEERDEMRTHLQVITETNEVAPETEAEGQTPEEILFDVIPVLKGCDEGLALEAEAAVGR